jgi:hypothetical protein
VAPASDGSFRALIYFVRGTPPGADTITANQSDAQKALSAVNIQMEVT